MLSLCVRYVNDRETARDLLQDGFYKVFTKINTYSGRGEFGGWIRRIFVTTALEYLRTANTLKMSIPFDEQTESVSSGDWSVLDCLSANELMACVGELAPGYRTVFNLYAIEGYSHKEIAELLGVSEVTSRSQFIRARNVLQKKVLLLIKQDDAGTGES
jgi:RNA polymerase sigma-70 factor (ECF subfamily)